MINKQPLIKFSLWFFTGLCIMFWGITHPVAASYNYNEFIAQLFDNYGPTLSAVTTNQTNNRWEGTIPDMTAYSSGAAWGISSPVVLIAGHTYSLTAKITGYYGGNIIKSTYDRIGVGNTLENARYSYQNNSNVNELYSNAPQTYGLIQFAFTTNLNGNYIVFPFSTTYTGINQTFWLENIVIDDLGASGVSQSQINTSLNNQTNTINNSITNSENNIKSNSDKNKKEIIDNQNENTDSINNSIDNVTSQLGSCYTNLLNQNNQFITNERTTYSHNGNTIVLNSSGWGSAYLDIPLKKAGTYTVSIDNSLENGGYLSIYYVSPEGIRGDWLGGFEGGGQTATITTNKTNGYLRIILGDTTDNGGTFTYWQLRLTDTSSKVDWVLYGNSKCTSKLDDTNNAINGVNDTLNDDKVDSSSWANFFNNFTTNTFGLTSIITAPLNLIQSLTSSSCTDLQLPLPYLDNKYLTLPCMNTIYSQYFGTFFTLYQTITYGIIAYWVCVRIFNLVKDFKNPEHDEIEVVDL